MKTTENITIAALLIALGIVIPMFMPKIIFPPNSYTLASHVPVMIAMFISPSVAIAVAIGTAWGFLISATDIIAMRALSHIVFAVLGSLYIQKNRTTLKNPKTNLIFNCVIGLIHVAMECLVVSYYYFNGELTGGNFFIIVVLGIGVGGFVHSLIDYFMASKVALRLNLSKP